MKDKPKSSKHQTKKCATAGVQAGICPCGIITTIYENYRHETLAQQWMHLYTMVKKYPQLENQFAKFTIIYDDACHFAQYAKNPKRKNIDS